MTVTINGNGTITPTTAINPAGSIIQVVQTEKVDAFTSASTSYTDITGLTADITVTGSNKVIVMLCLASGSNDARYNYYKLLRGSTHIFKGTQVGTYRPAVTSMEAVGVLGNAGAIQTKGITCVDTPGAGTHTYKLQGAVQGGTGELCVNVSSRDSDNNDAPNHNDPRMASSLILMEIQV